jgi:hypothetical protein
LSVELGCHGDLEAITDSRCHGERKRERERERERESVRRRKAGNAVMEAWRLEAFPAGAGYCLLEAITDTERERQRRQKVEMGKWENEKWEI